MKQSSGGVQYEKCLNPHCDRPVTSRGLCHACYDSAKARIGSGKTTWEALEAAGKSLPAKGGRRASNARTQWFD